MKYDTSYYAALALKTRRYRHCYVHTDAPRRHEEGDIVFTVSGYGRSLYSGGRKYKVHARRGDKPVPTTELKTHITKTQ